MTGSKATRVLMVSAHGVLRECVSSALAELGRFAVERCPCVESCRRGLDGTSSAAVLLADTAYPVPGQLDLLHSLDGRRPAVRTVLLGVESSLDSVGAAYLETGADASLPLGFSLDTLADAIERVLTGEKIYPPEIAFLLYRRLAQKSSEQDMQRRLAALALTPRELEILGLLTESRTNEAIALHLGISIHTVKNHVHNILDKLQVDNRAAAADLACSQGWLAEDPDGNGNI